MLGKGKKRAIRLTFYALCALSFLIFTAVGSFNKNDGVEASPLYSKNGIVEEGKILYTCMNGLVNTLDPAFASDAASSYAVAALYDTLLEYDYAQRPYELSKSMLAEMPIDEKDLMEYKFVLRDDLFFVDDPCFTQLGNSQTQKQHQKVTTRDVVFSLLRLADARLRSPGNWLWRDKIMGIDKFSDRTIQAELNDFTPYDQGCEGFEIIDSKTFKIKLEKPDPRFLYLLAIPYTSIVSRTAVEYYGDKIAETPVGSGAFVLKEWNRDYVIVMDKNHTYRRQHYFQAKKETEREENLPLLDRVVCFLVKQPLSTWLMFLQGELDISSLDKESFDAVVDEKGNLSYSLAQRGIQMIAAPSFEIVYDGFNNNDRLFKGNIDLRKAMSLAFDIKTRVRHVNNLLLPANGPIPPGTAGHNPQYTNPYGQKDLGKAAEYLAKAGYPQGIDPVTDKPLEVTFDIGYTESHYRQIGELMVADMKNIGIKIKPILNNKPRFYQKLREGHVQMFHLSWIGDYPDAENFLQLFYGPYAGTCNRANFKDKDYDKLFEEIKSMPECQERSEKYSRMAQYLTEQCPWIFEGYPLAYKLIHCWLENYISHDFAYNRWKYMSIDPGMRIYMKKQFRPMNMMELRK